MMALSQEQATFPLDRIRATTFDALFRCRIGLVAAATCVLVSMPLYTSIANRSLLGRWSPEYAAAMGVAIVAWLVSLWIGARSWRRARAPSRAATALDVALLCWGIAFVVSAADDPDSASRLLDFKPFGSVAPIAVMLEWLALVVGFISVGAWLARALPPRARNFALMVGSLTLLVLLGEGVARLRAVVSPAVVGFPTYSLTIWERRNVALNSMGYRDREHALQKPASTRRLLVIGDSYAFGWGVARMSDRFGEQLVARLDSATGARWESVNISKADRHTRQQGEFLQTGLQYRPDVAVLLYVFNDIEYLAAARGTRPLTTRNVLSEAPRNLLERMHPMRLLYWNSYLFQELYIRLRALSWRFMRADPSRDLYADSLALATHVRDLAHLASEARARGVVMGIVPFEPAVVYRDDVRRRYDRFVAAAQREGLQVWSLRDAFGTRDHSSLIVSSLDAHPNELAHRMAADAVVREILRVLR